MDLFEAIEKRASVRHLKPVQIPREHIETILDAGRRAPSGLNAQPYEFIVVTDTAMIRELASPQGFIADASALIAVVADPNASKYWLEDVSAATENMLLAITALGYASCWVEGTLLRHEDEMKRILGVPQNLRLMVFLPIGAPTAPGSQAPKKPLTELVHWNHY